MALLGNLENNLVELLKSLMNNDDFSKLVSIDSPNALSQSSSDDFFSLINERLFLKPKVNYPTSEEETYICIYMGEGDKAGVNNTKHNNLSIVVDIIVHLNLWDLEDNKTRPYRIVDIIYDNFIASDIKGVRGELVFMSTKLMRYNEKFMGYRIFFQYTGSTGC